MKLTTRTRYAIRAMVELASQPAGKVFRLHEIARRQHVKVKYLEQIFLKLHKGKLVTSKKGPGGGYMLGRAPERITLFDIIQVVGESTAVVQCAIDAHDKYCSGAKTCSIKPYWTKLKGIIDTFLQETSLNDIVEDTVSCYSHGDEK